MISLSREEQLIRWRTHYARRCKAKSGTNGASASWKPTTSPTSATNCVSIMTSRSSILYPWVKTALPTAELVAPRTQRAVTISTARASRCAG